MREQALTLLDDFIHGYVTSKSDFMHKVFRRVLLDKVYNIVKFLFLWLALGHQTYITRLGKIYIYIWQCLFKRRTSEGKEITDSLIRYYGTTRI